MSRWHESQCRMWSASSGGALASSPGKATARIQSWARSQIMGKNQLGKQEDTKRKIVLLLLLSCLPAFLILFSQVVAHSFQEPFAGFMHMPAGRLFCCAGDLGNFSKRQIFRRSQVKDQACKLRQIFHRRFDQCALLCDF